jgi:H+/Cl- antiporter ClcA
MRKLKSSFEHIFITRHLLKWTLLVIPLSAVVGSLVALFLTLLDLATKFRWQHEWLLFLLPLAGIAIYFLYKFSGKNAEAGNNMIMDEIHQPGGGVPARMTPLILVSTVITHLFGGSAGREGTAVQIGGSMANLLGKWYKLSKHDLRILLMTGISAGFGAVFGTPVAGAIFALEVLAIGRIKYDALIPCLIASILADIVCAAWGIHHTQYAILFSHSQLYTPAFLHFDFILLAKIVAAGVAFGLAGFLFSRLSHGIKNYTNKYIPKPWLIPVIGGVVIIGLTYLLGTRDYLGLGVTSKTSNGVSIVNAFKVNGVTEWSWLWKILFTAITLGAGFKGGEVTPLFFIGAALGNTLAVLMGAPVDLFAGLGFIAVFAGATNTPLACTLMGIELFGGDHLLYYAVACFTAYYFSGHSGIYSAQRLVVAKHNARTLTEEKTLKQMQAKKQAERDKGE